MFQNYRQKESLMSCFSAGGNANDMSEIDPNDEIVQSAIKFILNVPNSEISKFEQIYSAKTMSDMNINLYLMCRVVIAKGVSGSDGVNSDNIYLEFHRGAGRNNWSYNWNCDQFKMP